MMNEIENRLKELAKTNQERKLYDISLRKNFLLDLLRGIEENEQEIMDALAKDLGKPEFESYVAEIAPVKNEIKNAVKNLNCWSKSIKVSTPMAFLPGSSYIRPTPKGVVLIISPWNYPLQLSLLPLIGAIAAGNCVVLKPSELALQCALIMEKIIEKYVDKKFIAVLNGGVELAQKLLEYPFDHIFYTGSTHVGKEVMLAAAKNLTPVTLELGGKSPVIVHESANLEVAAKRIAWGKFLNAGQTCIAPDYVLVPSKIKDEFLQLLKKHIHHMFGENAQQSQSLGRIINKKHFERIVNYLADGKIERGGRFDEETLFIEPTILSHIKPNAKIMQEEIFGPLLPVIEIAHQEEIFMNIQKNPYPLALYIFAKDKNFIELMMCKTDSGSVCINDCVSQVAIKTLPFGGVRYSGMGSYHGKYTFDTFSHLRSVHERSNILDNQVRYAPYSDKKYKLAKMVV